MDHTRSLVVTLITLAVLALTAVVFVLTHHAHEAGDGSNMVDARVLDDALREASPLTVAVEEDSTRARMRAALVEAIRSARIEESISEAQELPEEREGLDAEDDAAPVAPDEDALPEAVPPPEPIVRMCAEFSPLPFPPGDGPLSVRVSEGARVLGGATTDASGTPLHVLQFPEFPTMRETPACVPEGGAGVLLDGTIVVPGQPMPHYGSGVVGYAFDGFPILGTIEDDREVTRAILDECHGHLHAITVDGVPLSLYHYHLTNDPPYSMSCVRGSP